MFNTFIAPPILVIGGRDMQNSSSGLRSKGSWGSIYHQAIDKKERGKRGRGEGEERKDRGWSRKD